MRVLYAAIMATIIRIYGEKRQTNRNKISLVAVRKPAFVNYRQTTINRCICNRWGESNNWQSKNNFNSDMIENSVEVQQQKCRKPNINNK